ncbi:MAG: Glu/Leu/Phe/Val dehydrogenase dimerization domain-containing protein [Planctomycetota bacterium]|nr:Glu/Leu/Phe/Val dehydrogenase dimerization domain-containing protein [Planctomycetota bacterium]
MQDAAYEEIVVLNDEDSGLHAIIAIHNTKFGPARGGLRIKNYAFPMDAMDDALTLSYQMSLKFAFYRLPYGGAKAILIHDEAHEPEKRKGRLRAFARSLKRFKDRFATGPDLGSDHEDLEIISRRAENVIFDAKHLALISDGTATGVMASLKGVCPDLTGKTTMVIGAGKVGSKLALLLKDAGAQVKISDVRQERAAAVAKQCSAEIIAPEDATITDCDILIPCAVGSSITAEQVPNLKCKIICGCENAQLAQDNLAQQLHENGIVWVPDFVANAGGAMIGVEMTSGSPEEQLEAVGLKIFEATKSLMKDARAQETSLFSQAIRQAQERLQTQKIALPR